jgi:dsRNA-specific ribonuclease
MTGADLCHRSSLQLVGDAFLSLIVTRLVLQEDPRLRVGNVTAFKGALVANRVLACLAAAYGLHYAHSRGVDTWQNVCVSADLFEAFCGAVCSSRGDSVCQMWLTDLYRPLVKKVLDIQRTAFYAPSTLDLNRGVPASSIAL